MFKKSLALLLAAFMAVAMAGCGKNAAEPGKSQPSTASGSGSNSSSGGGSSSGGTSSGSSTPAGTTSNNKTPEKKTYSKANVTGLKKGAKTDVGPLNVSLDDINVVTGVAGLPQGYAYLVLKLTVKNSGDDEYTVNVVDHFKVVDPAGKNRPFNMQGTQQRNPRLQGTIQKDQSQTGWVGYLVKADAGTFKFTFTHLDYGDATWEFSIK
jgi:hypothetical protein